MVAGGNLTDVEVDGNRLAGEECSDQNSEIWVQALGLRLLLFRVECLGFTVQGSGL